MANDIDIFGDEIMGLDEILGLVESSSGVKGSAAFKAALAKKLMAHAPVVQKIQPTKKRRQTVGFGPATVPAGQTLSIKVQPQCLFKGEKLIYTGDPAVGQYLFITGMFVGQQNQLPTLENPISVLTYNPGVLDNELNLDTCNPALSITLQVNNIGATDFRFAASLIGPVVS